jgi:hypothetical protein
MTKKIFRISSMTLGLALLLLGNGMNQAKADFTIKWPKYSNYKNTIIHYSDNKVYEVFLEGTMIADGPASDTSHNNINVIGAKNWSFYQQGVINIQVKIGNAWVQPFASLPMTSWKNTGKNSINDVLNKTTLTLNSNGTITITYPN